MELIFPDLGHNHSFLVWYISAFLEVFPRAFHFDFLAFTNLTLQNNMSHIIWPILYDIIYTGQSQIFKHFPSILSIERIPSISQRLWINSTTNVCFTASCESFVWWHFTWYEIFVQNFDYLFLRRVVYSDIAINRNNLKINDEIYFCDIFQRLNG